LLLYVISYGGDVTAAVNWEHLACTLIS